MNILQLTSRFRIGGIASYIHVLSSGLKQRGHHVTIAAGSDTAVSLLTEENIPFISLPIETKFEWHPKLWSTGKALSEIVQNRKIDIVHAHTRVTQVLAERVCKKLNKPVVTTCHGFYPPRWGRRMFPCWGDRVVAISYEVKEHLEKVLRVNPGDITVVLNAVPVSHLLSSFAIHDRDEVRKKFGFDRSDFILGCVARLEKVKGQSFLLDALEILKNKIPSLKIILVGGGKEKVSLEKRVREKGLSERVVFAGELIDIVPALRAMDAFVSAHTWQEGFGLSIAEAMVCGLPVIVSDTGALRHLIHDQETGMLVPASDSHALSEVISALVNDETLRTRIAGRGHQFALRSFSPERMAEGIESVYEKVSKQYTNPIASSSLQRLPKAAIC